MSSDSESEHFLEAPDISSSHPSTISAWANRCHADLVRLLDAFEESDAPDEARVEIAHVSLGRFRVWGQNIGAFKDAASRSSLDSRLGFKSSIGDAAPDRKLSDNFHDADGQTPTYESNSLVGVIDSSIDELFHLSMAIRRQRPGGRLPPSSELIRQDPDQDIQYVKDVYPKVKQSPWLSERLGKAIAWRKDYFRYRQEHMHRLGGSISESKRPVNDTYISATNDTSDNTNRDPSTIATTYQTESQTSASRTEESSEEDAPASVRTRATSFLTKKGKDDIGELTVPKLTSLEFKGVRLGFTHPFLCPFCMTVQNFEKESDWKTHFFTDFKPYVCTFEHCNEDLFTTRQGWFDHEHKTHRRRWCCNMCESEFDSPSGLAGHFGKDHPGSVADAQLPTMLTICEKPIRYFDANSCPICDDWNPASDQEDNVEGFRSHLARHLQKLALEARPVIDGLAIIKELDGENEGDAAYVLTICAILSGNNEIY
ncbi:hypothetical protein GQ53DRAFT_718810 [Thozetella sp. PMI_491]|nr:hypothetical protein GQ53DRAFT_718810 [Thozetella sp. PMI_491]